MRPAAGSFLCAAFDALEAIGHPFAEIFHPFRDIGLGAAFVIVMRWADGKGFVICAKIAGVVFFQRI